MGRKYLSVLTALVMLAVMSLYSAVGVLPQTRRESVLRIY